MALLVVVDVEIAKAVLRQARLLPVTDEFRAGLIINDPRERQFCQCCFARDGFHEIAFHFESHREFEPRHFLLQLGKGRLRLRQRLLDPARHIHAAVARAHDDLRGAEEARERVVVPLAEGIELVIVAASAADRETEEGATDGVDLLVHRVEMQLLFVTLREHLRPEREETRSDHLTATLLGSLCGHEITRDLLANELVERFVVIEGINDVVPVTPGLVEGVVAVTAVRVGVAHEVQPVAAPFFTELRTAEELLDVGGQVGRV